MEKPKAFGKRKSATPAPSATPPTFPLSTSTAPAPGAPDSKLAELLRIPRDRRLASWNKEFEKAIFGGWFHELDPRQLGPDRHHYYAVCLAEKNEKNAMKFANVAKKAMNEGLGLAIFTPGNTKPDFVFFLGQLINVAMHKELLPLGTCPAGPTGAFTTEPGEVFTGQVPPDVMPEPARRALRQYLLERYGIQDVSVQHRIELYRPDGDPMSFRKMESVMFYFKNKPDCDLQYLMDDLYWFMRPTAAPAMITIPTGERYFPL